MKTISTLLTSLALITALAVSYTEAGTFRSKLAEIGQQVKGAISTESLPLSDVKYDPTGGNGTGKLGNIAVQINCTISGMGATNLGQANYAGKYTKAGKPCYVYVPGIAA